MKDRSISEYLYRQFPDITDVEHIKLLEKAEKLKELIVEITVDHDSDTLEEVLDVYVEKILDITKGKAMSKEYKITVHNIEEDGYPPEDLSKAGLVGRVCFIFDGGIYSGWPIDVRDSLWEDAEFGHKMGGVKQWIELPVPGWKL